MNITLLYFASFADKAQKGQEQRQLDAETTLTELYNQLQAQYGFNLEASQVRVAINDEFSEWDDSLHDGDTVVFIPPVAGG